VAARQGLDPLSTLADRLGIPVAGLLLLGAMRAWTVPLQPERLR